MIKLCHPPIRLLLTVCPVDMGRLSQHLPPMAPVLQMQLDIGYLVKAAPLAPAVGKPLISPPPYKIEDTLFLPLCLVNMGLIIASIYE